MPHLKISGANSIACPLKIFISGIKTNNQPVLNYFFFKVSIVVVVLTVVSFFTIAVSGAGAGVTTLDVSEVVVVSSFFSALLQAAKDTDTIAKAKITFFICVLFKF
jgi:hypothetical protein